jgi:phage shock protein PspC (stress-responsive transcriptional regulator)
MQENPEAQEKKNTKGNYFEVPGVVKANSTEKPAAKPEKKMEEKSAEETQMKREASKASDFKAPGELETGYTEKSWAKPEKTMEGKEGIDTSALEKEIPKESDFKPPGQPETGYTDKSWTKPEKEAKEENKGAEEKKGEAGGEKSTAYSMKKRLVKSKKDRMLFGVCGGIGEYFGIDSTIIRLIFVGLAFLNGFGLLLYIILAIIMPSEESVEMIPRSQGNELQK